MVRHSFIVWALILTCESGFAFSGVVRMSQGEVQIKSGQDGALKRARIGEKVYPSDIVITSTDGRVKLLMIDDSEILVGSGSAVVIQKFQFEKGKSNNARLLNVVYGKVRAKVRKSHDGKTSRFQISTPIAVAGVRGTDFSVDYDQTQTQVYVFEGQVEFGLPGQDRSILKPVMIAAGQAASTTRGALPSLPVALVPEEVNRIEEVTKVNPEVEPSSAPVSALTKVDASELTSRMHWRQFELGVTRLFQSRSADASGPFIGYAPHYYFKRLPQWIYFSPRFDVQFSKTTAGEVNPLYTLGLQSRFLILTQTEVALDLSLAFTTEKDKSDWFPVTGLWLAHNLKFESESFFNRLNKVMIGYRRMNSPIKSNQIVVGMGFGFD